ncbi:putative geraniol 8-hydroxylase [Helianthus annuus]|nr:putative geraniol 8-hydroxylase [Helianthus annuus]
MVLVLFVGGTDTVSSTLEWAMPEFIHNPNKLEKARLKVTKLMKNKKDIIQESYISQLPYLETVIKETLRLHPPAPFSYPSPSHTRCRNPRLHGVDYISQDFELISFGAGKRICPGLNMAHRMLHIMVGSLIQNFDWKLEGNIRAHDMDMSERFGLTLQRSMSLKAIPLGLQWVLNACVYII